ncbi:aldo/keto reductase [Halococcoides cellulosivorans]|uniref:Aldehyde oxidoreductase n=1 Tax=Halococcoides cellulosivorans TaxID=1679096 RepID=A0A2R4WYU9_9EURY|nr:aldo/keto reductase [Halococcoides cellulosivorans]AWB26712.1 aldehyde oxidoreductase [Halococcoides cellulosivorans]
MELPPIGLGTWENEDPEQCAESVRMALDAGYRHVDTAEIYGNEEWVGEGIARADLDREEIFLASKVHAASTSLSYDGVIDTVEGSLDRLGVESLDLCYVHWPTGDYEPEETLAAYDELRDRGLIDRVGVSNFEPFNVDRALDELDAPLFANQVELHPWLTQDAVREHARAHDYHVVAYSPLARGDVLDDPTIHEIAEEYGVSPAQVTLAWHLSLENVTPIPKATSREHIEDNLASLDLDLDSDALERIDGIDREERKLDFDVAPWNQ